MVNCKCGAQKDDGRPMIECEECKVWQHTKCVLGKASKKKPPACFVCNDCQQKTMEMAAAAAKVNSPVIFDPSQVSAAQTCFKLSRKHLSMHVC